jgi:hypothetical protein|tara:strand:+ start:1086 stop:1259 length:174 start_codon:yes stop_codon:yes gene_type:complete
MTQTSFRLPSPPSQYNLGFMTRLINALELNTRVMFFGATKATRNLSDEAQSISWFMN